MDKTNDDFGQMLVDGLNRSIRRDTSVFNSYVRDAVRFALQTHEINQKQKRKGKDIPYITHPLTVGMILASSGAPEHIVVAGILHDTIEDSAPEHKVDHAMLSKRFGSALANIVAEVSEPSKEMPWAERKRQALEHIETMEGPSLWVKSADVISNVSEILDDYAESGEVVFTRFSAPREPLIRHFRAVIAALIKRWEEPSCGEIRNPLLSDLKTLAYDLERVSGTSV